MEKVGHYELDSITEDDILEESLKEVIHKHEESAKVTRVMLPAAVFAIALDYLLPMFFFKDLEVPFYLTRPGMFLGLMGIICFGIFIFFAVKQHNLLKDEWRCPHCRQVFPYHMGQTIIGMHRFGNKDLLDECYNSGIFLGKLQGSPVILPGRCPNCREQLTKQR
ncbi:MAG: hypothetical protein IJM69_01370 [Firmicutes bacterium]|nr:hypothetical protein [Bacillota bacterium]